MYKVDCAKSLAERIQQARLALGMSQSALARKLGVKPQAVQHWEKGTSSPKTDRIADLALVLDVQVSWLLVGNEQGGSAVHESVDSTYGELTIDEKRLIKMFRRMQQEQKETFFEISKVMLKDIK